MLPQGVKLMTALQRRFDPSFQRVREGIVDGSIGDPIVVKLCSRDPAPPPVSYVKGGGGIFKDMAIHDLDMSRFLMGWEVVSWMPMASLPTKLGWKSTSGQRKRPLPTVITLPSGCS